ncbi:hypothetical protein LCG56_28670 (plasmid) [Pseudomonas cannabina pv. alisalensis]|uniref:Uncharacterized protein n=1 Tax=Pseudomonas syringae pv. maculicola str. ES4326 TaxID=629265 RepID=A0A8T8CCB9_PSEYM|nr:MULTISPECIES: hypothetical protein [Pseudomonas syringae group]QHF00734.1 hypothetical protein PMA4326_030040 [Pseudomonas syringae pv. maculicola str. ES4326]UBZ00344.1 hypothetical protein LCG56_28670 [Pseudomonas cannabina pv. alisalensis]
MEQIITPGKKWIPAAKVVAETPTTGNESGFYKRLSGGIHFYDLDGQVFACLITNRYGERFFVTATARVEGIFYMHSTCSITEKKLGLTGLGLRVEHELASNIVDELDTLKANAILLKLGVTFDQFVAMANRETTTQECLNAFHKAGLTTELQGIEDDGYLLATRLGRTMLQAAGYQNASGKWVKTPDKIAA